VRKTILHMLHRAGASHLGSSMSLVELLIAAYRACDIGKIAAQAANRDRVIVSKGHGACATYAVMHHFGLLSEAEIASYHHNDTVLAGHVSHRVRNVEHSTGALGHGLAVAAGIAYGLRSGGHPDALVFCVLGDGEIQEGSVWEALMFAHHHRLSRLIPIIDNNRISSITRTASVIDMEPLAQRFAGFGFKVHDVDGHNLDDLGRAIAELRAGSVPGVIIANTIKGKGVPFAENQPIWHYRSLNDQTLGEALAALEG
jgi:transketolase